jgi:hypothetical protein
MRKVLIISVSVASVFISGGILAGIAMLQNISRYSST